MSNLARIRCPGGADEEKREKKKEQRREVEGEEFFNSFGLKKTDDEVKEEDDESGTDTGTGLGEKNGDEEKKSSSQVKAGKRFFLSSMLEEEGKGEKCDQIGREPVRLTKSREDSVLDILDPEMFVDTEVFEDAVDRDERGRTKKSMEEVN